MKTLNLILILGLIFAGAFASAAGVESSIGGFKLATCKDKNTCAVVTADKTQGSQLKMLHTLSNPQITMTSPAGKELTLHGDTGYIDIEENQLVLYKRINGKLQETSVNLSSFTVKQGSNL